MDEGFKVEGVCNGYRDRVGVEVQEIEVEIFTGSLVLVFPGDILEKSHSPYRQAGCPVGGDEGGARHEKPVPIPGKTRGCCPVMMDHRNWEY